MIEDANSRLALKLAGVALAMFGFGYALVPLYDVFCDITGLNGKTGRISVNDTRAEKAVSDRQVTVQFDTNVNGPLPWEFKALQHSMKVRPGELETALFTIENKAGHSVVGQAIPSVSPGQASLYFNKTECFCFTQQTLAGNEKMEIPVRFVVDPDLPEAIEVLTLSYTFFKAPEQKSSANLAKNNKESST